MFISRSTDPNPDLSDPNPDLHDYILLDPNTCLLVRVRTRIRIYQIRIRIYMNHVFLILRDPNIYLPDLSDPNPDLHESLFFLILRDPNIYLLVKIRIRINIYQIRIRIYCI